MPSAIFMPFAVRMAEHKGLQQELSSIQHQLTVLAAAVEKLREWSRAEANELLNWAMPFIDEEQAEALGQIPF
jgi:signal transduction histidine kinase